MGLETPTYIDDFNPLWPLNSDQRQYGAAHLRNMKAAIQATFPGIDAPTFLSETFLSVASMHLGLTKPLIHRHTDNGAAAGPLLLLDRSSASPAASDELGELAFTGRDSGAGVDKLARIVASIVDPTAASEDAQINFGTMVAGTLATRGYFGKGLVIGSPTGGDALAGALNAERVSVNGGALWEVISEATPSGAAAATFTGISADYDDLWLSYNIHPATNNVSLVVQTYGADGNLDNAGSDYAYAGYGEDTASGAFTTGTASANGVPISFSTANSSTNRCNGNLFINDIQAATATQLVNQSGWLRQDSAAFISHSIWGVRLEADRITGLRVVASSGNLTGRLVLMGRKGA